MTMNRSLFAVLAAVVAALILAPTAGATRLYTPEYFPDTIDGFNVAGDGGLAPIAGSPFRVGAYPAGNGGGAVAFTPDGTRAAMAYWFNGGIQGLNVDANGAVAVAQPVVGAHKGTSLAISPDGKYAFQAISEGTNGVDAYSIGADGKLTAIPGSPFYPADSFLALAVSPDGKYLYGSVSGSAIRPLLIHADGTLEAKPAKPAPGANQLEFSPDGRTLFWTNSFNNSLNSFSVTSDGALTTVGSPVVIGSTNNGFFGVAPNGRFVYSSDYNGETLGSNTWSINSYRIGADGALSFAGAASTLPYRCRTMVVSPGSNYAYCGTDSSKLIVAPIGANGVPGVFREVGTWVASEPTPFIFAPEFGGTATFKSTATTKPLLMSFDGTGSTAPGGAVDDYGWSFGDGATTSLATPKASHTFPAAGVYTVSLTASRVGCADKTIYTGQTTVCNGSPTALKTVTVDTPPWITSLTLSPSSLSKKSRISFKLTEAATVTFVVQKPVAGRTVGTSCKKQTKANNKKKKCTRWVRASKKFKASGKPRKTNKLKFTGKVKRVKLPKGSYRVYALAKDKAKQLSPSRTVKFKVKR